ncbi:GOLPH3/VPS74 family protein [Nocardioides sp. SYSU DS0663]|uniref:GOLPH3/VPS74 family protein n=1 Tax=Nocardioides sp. SYSU DS0663 TaxID=3416445 RepID=UPI003F4B6C1C
MTLIGEDLLLLLLDDESGSLQATTHLQVALGGALLVELALRGAVEVEEKRGFWHTAKVRAVAPASAVADEPELADALSTVAERDRSAQDLVTRLGKGARDRLLGSLVERGLVRLEHDKLLGLFPRRRWPAVDSAHEEQVRRALRAALVEGAEPDDRTRALVALLHALGRAHRTIDHEGLSGSQVRRRAKELAEGEWAAAAVRDAITASTAAVTTAVTVGVATGSS